MPSPLDEFLAWLSPEQEEAAMKHEELRKRLTRFFIGRRCHIPDELADRTLERVRELFAEGRVDRSVDPIPYCFRVAKYIDKEHRKKQWPDSLNEDVPWVDSKPAWNERELACLDQCVAKLNEHDRDLVTRWFQCNKGREKIDAHKKMAEEAGGRNKLGLRILRIKGRLRKCVIACLNEDGWSVVQ
jgi:hypothetical protein